MATALAGIPTAQARAEATTFYPENVSAAPFGYGAVRQAVVSTEMKTGTQWCGSLWPTAYQCIPLNGRGCEVVVPQSELVTCNRTGSSPIDEPLAQSSAGRDINYLQNDYVRAGIRRSSGGAISMLSGADRLSRLEDSTLGRAHLELQMGWGSYAIPPIPSATTTLTTGGLLGDLSAADFPNTFTVSRAGNPLVPPTSTGSASGLDWAQTVHLTGPFLLLSYQVSASSRTGWSKVSQEAVSLLSQKGFAGATVYYYNGSRAYENPTSSVTAEVSTPGDLSPHSYHMPGRLKTPSAGQTQSTKINITEDWISLCDPSGKCFTLASFSPGAQQIVYGPGDSAYLGLIGSYPTAAGPARTINVWLAPYRFDDVVQGRSIRQWLYELRPTTRVQTTRSTLKKALLVEAVNENESPDNRPAKSVKDGGLEDHAAPMSQTLHLQRQPHLVGEELAYPEILMPVTTRSPKLQELRGPPLGKPQDRVQNRTDGETNLTRSGSTTSPMFRSMNVGAHLLQPILHRGGGHLHNPKVCRKLPQVRFLPGKFERPDCKRFPVKLNFS